MAALVGGGQMTTIKIGLVGIGNCASSLIQGINYYRGKDGEEAIGLISGDINRMISRW